MRIYPDWFPNCLLRGTNTVNFERSKISQKLTHTHRNRGETRTPSFSGILTHAGLVQNATSRTKRGLRLKGKRLISETFVLVQDNEQEHAADIYKNYSQNLWENKTKRKSRVMNFERTSGKIGNSGKKRGIIRRMRNKFFASFFSVTRLGNFSFDPFETERLIFRKGPGIYDPREVSLPLAFLSDGINKLSVVRRRKRSRRLVPGRCRSSVERLIIVRVHGAACTQG